ncbi:MAG TPA: hypothetical protein VMB50_01445 [Myxococcales bacterium]|nr:hypothetical protein [Myxococcales bacterium]
MPRWIPLAAALCWAGCSQPVAEGTSGGTGSAGTVGGASTGGASGAAGSSGAGASSTGGNAASGSSGAGASSTGGAGSSGTGTTGGAGTGGASTTGGSGGLSVTLETVGVHPAALAALAGLSKPLTPPSLASGYTLLLEGVSVSGFTAQITVLGEIPLDATNDQGPITFSNVDVSGGVASLGLLSAIVSDADIDAGFPAPTTWPSCDQLYGTADAGFQDSFVVSACQVHFGTPTASITDGVAFAMPASYVALLDCAAGYIPGSLFDNGVALLYASANAAALGNPLAGVTFSGTGTILYYPAGYTFDTASTTSPTSSAGVATVTGISTIVTLSASGDGDTFKGRDVSTPAGDVYQVFYAPGT